MSRLPLAALASEKKPIPSQLFRVAILRTHEAAMRSVGETQAEEDDNVLAKLIDFKIYKQLKIKSYSPHSVQVRTNITDLVHIALFPETT